MSFPGRRESTNGIGDRQTCWNQGPVTTTEPAKRRTACVTAGKEGVRMAKRNRQTSKKRDREMSRKQKKQDKAERTAARKADRGPTDDAGQGPATPDEDAGDPPAALPQEGLESLPAMRRVPREPGESNR